MRASILPPPGTSLSMGKFSGSLAPSPDGTRLVFAAADADGRQMLYVRSLESLVAQPLVGSEGAAFPFWSPDGTQIAFFAGGRLLRISAAGGAAFTICPAPDGRGGSWSKDDVIAFSPSTQTGLYRVAAAGGAPTPLTQIEPATRETTHRYPWFLPDGKRFVYLAGSHNLGVRDEVHGVYLSSLEDPAKRRRLVTARSNAQVSQQTLLFTRDQFLMAQRFDPGTIEPVGDPFPVAENVQYERGFFMAAYSVSQNGLLVHRNGAATRAALVLVDEKGKRLRQIADPGDYGQVRVSPDGRRAAVSVADPANLNEDVWIFDLERGTRTRLSFGEGPDRAPVWSPDGRRVAYQSQGSSDIYVRSASGGGSEEVLYQSPALDTPEDWSRDGRFLTFDKVEGNKTDLWILDLEAGKAEALVATAAEEGWGRFSPDGKWLAFLSNESGRFQLYAVRFPNVEDGRWQITTDSAEWLVGWNDAGNALYYLDSESNLVRVGVKAGESFEVGAPERLFGVESELTWANSGDGKSFVVGKSPEGRDQGPMTLVVDWLPEQKAR